MIDVEASGMGRGSYPIEVGVALPGGETHCMIIRPEQEWLHWDNHAEDMHGISRQTLQEYGHNVKEVARQLNAWLGGTVAYSDAWGQDSSWLALLFETAEMSQHFQLDSLRSLMSEQQAAIWHDVKAQVVDDCGYRRHRASQDALILQHTFVRTAALTAKRSASAGY